jgi:spermidine synthase
MVGGDGKPRRWFAEQSDSNELILLAVDKTVTKARTAIQDVEIVETPSYGTMLILDGVIQSAEDDEHSYHEALVHPGMIAHANPREVLIVGGGEGATLREVLRYRSVERATMVDIDSQLIELCKAHLDDWHQNSFDDPRAEVIIADGREYLETTDRTFDVVICDITDFIDSGPALKLYTKQFYELVAGRLNPGGVLIVQALETSNMDAEEHAMLVRTVGEAFTLVRSYVTFISSFMYSWGFLVASQSVDASTLPESEVDARIAERLSSELKSYDGITHRGYFSLPKDLRALLTAPGEVLDDATIETWSAEELVPAETAEG